MLDTLHKAGHKYLKLLFVLALAGSSALFFIGSAVPKPPTLLVVVIGGVLGVALEWSYFTVSCDLTQSVTERHTGAIMRDGFYTLIGAVASWFLFTNAALHVGWAPADDLLGLSRKAWAMIMAGLVVAVIFMLSARSKPPKSNTDLQAIARSILIMLPDAPDTVRLQLLSTIAGEAAKHTSIAAKDKPKALAAPKATPVPTSNVPAGQPITGEFRTLQPGESEAADNGNQRFH
jgi:protein-S-isoprenylcysteine O-methyltransferase Ste14